MYICICNFLFTFYKIHPCIAVAMVIWPSSTTEKLIYVRHKLSLPFRALGYLLIATQHTEYLKPGH